MASVADGLKFAHTFDGLVERPVNLTKIGEMYGWNGVAWCQQFVWVILDHFKLAPLKTASTVAAANDWFARHRLIDKFEDLEPGDQIFYNFTSEPNERQFIEHTGLVLQRPSGGNVLAIEGNTSSGTSGSQSNGGGVFTRTRPASFFVCAARPEWSGSRAPSGGAKAPPNSIEFGDKGHDVRFWQQHLNLWSKEKGKGKINLEVDGEFGEATRRATKIFQEAHGFEADGSVGLKLIHKIEEREGKDDKPAKPGDKDKDK
jgi:putative peptidoglycan binding protein